MKERILAAIVLSATLAILQAPAGAGASAGRLIQPEDLVYAGAFRLPDEPPEIGWEYGGSAMAYYPHGDPTGQADGYPGSIFGTGNDQQQYVSEISIPAPIISRTKNVKVLNTARTLQPFTDIRGNLSGPLEIPRVGLEYLPKQGQQTTDKLHFCWAQHMEEGEKGPTHGWCDLNLAHPRSAGLWRVGDYDRYVTSGYLFAVPREWADLHAPGMLLATGRYRDGGQGGRGPSLFACAPWKHGSPPATGARLSAVPLILYSNVTAADQRTMKGYHHSDEWEGGAWLTAGGRSAVMFVGTKGTGARCWYGFADGTVWPDNPPFPRIPPPPNNDRGWWSEGFQAQMIFYDPDDLAAVAKGQKASHTPQPYAAMNLDPFLYRTNPPRQKSRVGSMCYDRDKGVLYVFERFADGDKPLVHVWKIR